MSFRDYIWITFVIAVCLWMKDYLALHWAREGAMEADMRSVEPVYPIKASTQWGGTTQQITVTIRDTCGRRLKRRCCDILVCSGDILKDSFSIVSSINRIKVNHWFPEPHYYYTNMQIYTISVMLWPLSITCSLKTLVFFVFFTKTWLWTFMCKSNLKKCNIKIWLFFHLSKTMLPSMMAGEVEHDASDTPVLVLFQDGCVAVMLQLTEWSVVRCNVDP